MAKHKRTAAEVHTIAEEAASGNPWLRFLLRVLGVAGIFFGGGSLIASILPLPNFLDQAIDWYQTTAHPAMAAAIGSVIGTGFFARWAADIAVTSLGGALLAFARRPRK